MEAQDELEYEEGHEWTAYQYPKVEKRFPRKLKKKIKKIPVGDDCYGSAIGDKGKMINSKRVFKPIMCPFHQHHYCGLIMFRDDMFMDDFLKICDYKKYQYLAKPFTRDDSYSWSWNNKITAFDNSKNEHRELTAEGLEAKERQLKKWERINQSVDERTKYLWVYRRALNTAADYIRKMKGIEHEDRFEFRRSWDIHKCRIEMPQFNQVGMDLMNAIYDDLYIAAHRNQNASAETIERGLNNADKLVNFLYPEI